MTISFRHQRMLRRLLKRVVVWGVVLAIPIVALQVTRARWVDKAGAIPEDTVAQIVPAVVIAIFVFAIGIEEELAIALTIDSVLYTLLALRLGPE